MVKTYEAVQVKSDGIVKDLTSYLNSRCGDLWKNEDVVANIVNDLIAETIKRTTVSTAEQEGSAIMVPNECCVCEPLKMLLGENETFLQEVAKKIELIDVLEKRSNNAGAQLISAQNELTSAIQKNAELQEEVVGLKEELCQLATRLCEVTEQSGRQTANRSPPTPLSSSGVVTKNVMLVSQRQHNTTTTVSSKSSSPHLKQFTTTCKALKVEEIRMMQHQVNTGTGTATGSSSTPQKATKPVLSMSKTTSHNNNNSNSGGFLFLPCTNALKSFWQTRSGDR